MKRNRLLTIPKEFRPRPRRPRRTEGSIEEACREHAHRAGFTSRKMNGLGFNSWPDRLFLPPRGSEGLRAFWVEFKRPGEVSTRAQADMQTDLAQRGETVYVDVTSLDQFKAVIAQELVRG